MLCEATASVRQSALHAAIVLALAAMLTANFGLVALFSLFACVLVMIFVAPVSLFIRYCYPLGGVGGAFGHDFGPFIQDTPCSHCLCCNRLS